MLNQSWQRKLKNYPPQKWIGAVFTVLILFAFQNCGKVDFGSIATAANNGAAAVTVYTYSWTSLGYGACSNTCGTGTSTPNVACVRSDNTTVDDSFCSGIANPFPTLTCTDSSGCVTPSPTPAPTYSWVNYGYGACSNTCGSGTQTANNSCVRSDGVTVANSFCSAIPTSWLDRACTDNSGCAPMTTTTTLPPAVTTTTLPPAVTTTTTTQPPAPVYTYTWTTNGYGACTTTCGLGSSYPNVSCVRNDGLTVDGSNCGGLYPGPIACSSTAGCPVYSYSWSATSYGACSNSCGSGTASAASTACIRSDGATVDNSYCAGAAAPAAIACSDSSGCVAAITTTTAPPTPTPAPSGGSCRSVCICVVGCAVAYTNQPFSTAGSSFNECVSNGIGYCESMNATGGGSLWTFATTTFTPNQ